MSEIKRYFWSADGVNRDTGHWILSHPTGAQVTCLPSRADEILAALNRDAELAAKDAEIERLRKENAGRLEYLPGRMMQIDQLIKELQAIRAKFGNTCVYTRDLAWGALALNREAEDTNPSPARRWKEPSHDPA